MCGIAAVINGTREELEKMAEAQKHRGIKTLYHTVGNLQVAFAYLPITDKNEPGYPFKAGKYTVWMNGYISNYRELADLYDIKLETDCDTELLAKFLQRFDRTKLHELNGFFAVLYDDGEHPRMFTDRYGIKQLYWNLSCSGTSYIASEPKAILAVMPGTKLAEAEVTNWKHNLGIMHHSNPTIYEGMRMAKRLNFNYCRTPKDIPYDDACKILEALWKQSVNRNRVEDHQTGVLLSGGVDSGMVALHMHPHYCFSMDYEDPAYSEIENIKHNTAGIHYTMICNAWLAKEYTPKALHALDDFKASSCYTNFALTELAAKHCRVLYSGAGGDEVFNGYTHRYNKPIAEVIKRTDYEGPTYKISHKEYDWAYLRGILVVEDRMSAYHTMETRYPLLDNDLVDFALSLPPEYTENKRILKDISGLHPEVTGGKKRGFCNPYLTNTQWVDYVLENSPYLKNKK